MIAGAVMMSGIQVLTGYMTANKRADEAVEAYEGKCTRLKRLLERIALMDSLLNDTLEAAEYQEKADMSLALWNNDVTITKELIEGQKRAFLKTAAIAAIMCTVMATVALVIILTRSAALEGLLAKVRDMGE
jgi:hypothetical protein